MRFVIVVAALFVFGLVRLPIERDLAKEYRDRHFHGAKLNLDLRQQVSQVGFLAALSGLRAMVAELLWIQAHSAWERTEWGRMALLFDSVTALQPRAVMFWDMAAWHMAWNASIGVMKDPGEMREALQIKASREYARLGEDFLRRGIQNNPDRYLLHERLGLLYKERLQDPCAAAEAYGKAAEFSEAPGYVKRMAVYELARCPGREREAYERLVEIYRMGEQEHLPTLLKLIDELAKKLGVPPSERVYTP